MATAVYYSHKQEIAELDTEFESRVEECHMDTEEYYGGQQDVFSKCPEEIKLDILSYITEPSILCTMSMVCKYWSVVTAEQRLWRYMFNRDFMWWSKSKTYEVKLEEGITWKDKYAEYHSKGWQWDNENCNSKILLTNNNFSAHLVTGYTYHGLRTTRSEESGRHYFEVLISPTEDDSKFNRGSTIYMGVGVATTKFNPDNCCSGWTKENCGIGYYNDGQIYALSERHFNNHSQRKMSFKAGDRVGVELDLDVGTVVFYINDVAVTDPIKGLSGRVYPHLILANDIKNRVTITTGKRGGSFKADKATAATTTQELTKGRTSIYEEQLRALADMGFLNRDICIDLLHQFNGDVEKVVNELLI